MRFILCNNATYEEKYQEEAYKNLRLEQVEDLLGYAGIEVLIEDGWEHNIYDDRTAFLQEQLEALGVFGYIRVVYIEEDGQESRVHSYNPSEQVLASSQGGSLPLVEKSPQGLSEDERMALLETEGGCAGGACVI